MRKVLILLAILMVLPLMTAQNFIFPQNNVIDLKVSCFDQTNNFCNASVACNLTILSPIHTVIVDNQPMTFNTAFYNLTLNSSQTSNLGEHSTIGICAGNTTGFSTFTFLVTADGKPFEAFPNQFAVILFAIILVIFGLFDPRWTLLKHMGSITLMVMGVLTLFPGYNFINHTNLFGLALGSILVVMGFWFLIDDSFSREGQEERFQQPQGQEEVVT